MEREQLIAADQFCDHYNVSISFVRSLHDVGLIETVIKEETEFIPFPHLEKIERMIRLHEDLQINIEGIEAIDHLLSRIENLQQEMISLKNRLRLYESL